MVPFASPPVPQVSTTFSGASTFPAKRRMARAKPTISGTALPPYTQRGQERGGGGGWSATLHDGLQGALGLTLGEGLTVAGFP